MGDFVHCINCGSEFGINDKFCGKCGNPNPKFDESNTSEEGEISSSNIDSSIDRFL